MTLAANPATTPSARRSGDEQLDQFFELAIDILAVAGLDGCFHRMSHGVTRVLGYDAGDLIDQAFLDFVPQEDCDRVWRMFGQLAAGETVRDFQVQFLHRDGSFRWLSWNASAPVGDGITYMVGRDITANHEAKEKLRLSEERFDLAVQGASDGLWDWVDLRGTAQWWSPRFYELLGMEDGEIAPDAAQFLAMIDPRERAAAEQALRAHLDRGEPLDFTCSVKTKPGTLRRYRIRGAATRNEKGVPVRMSGSLSDVTESLEMVERLERSEQLLRATGALAQVGGWEIDANSLSVRWSPEVAEIHEHTGGGQPSLSDCIDFYAPEARPLVRNAIERTLRDAEPWDLELPLITAAGRHIWVRSQGQAESKDGRVERIHAALQNITARKEAEQQVTETLAEVEESRSQLEQQARQLARQAAELAIARESAERAARLKGAFLATMSHEIRTPMNGVLGMVSLLDGTKLSEEQREYLETIRVSGESLLEIINEVLDYSKTEAGKTAFASTPFDLARCCEEAADMLASKAAAKRLDLSVFISPSCPLELRGDPGRLRQVLVNLIGNALKFTEAGRVSVRVEPVRESPGLLRFEVRDTGIGIEKTVLPNLFQPFTQADSASTRRFGGTGLGLAISKQIVEAAGGRIGASSEPGRGATFWFELELPVLREAKPESAAPLNGAGVVILARAPGLRETLDLYFSSWGAETLTADSVDQAAEAIDRYDRFRLVVADAGAPFGYSIAELGDLARERPNLRLAVASLPGAREIDEARTRNMEVLYKPIKRGRVLSWATNQSPRREENGRAPARPVNSLRVLVAEDNPVNQKISLKMLERLGHDAALAVNGREALKRARSEPFDLILMDCQMPEMDGYQAARELRRISNSPPIVALTANALEGDRQRCLDSGMDDYLPKPIDLAALAAALERWGASTERRPTPAA